MSQQQQDEAARLAQAQADAQAQNARQIVPPHNPQNKTDAAQKTSKTFMEYLKEHWWIVLLVLALIAFAVYWFCFRKPKGGAGGPVLLGGNSGGTDLGVTATTSGTSTAGTGTGSGRTSGSTGSSAPKLNITNQRLSN